MSLPSSTVTSSLPALTSPTTISPPGWLYPAALNTTFVSNFNAGLSTATNSIYWGNGTITKYPPAIFGSYGSRPDITLDSIYSLTFQQHVASAKPANSFGRDEVKVSIRSGDTIALDWEGGEEKVVAMTCHSCLRYNLQTQNVFDACQRYTQPHLSHLPIQHLMQTVSVSYSELMQFHSGSLSTNAQHMKSQFSNPLRLR